jgi:hypothetical protein
LALLGLALASLVSLAVVEWVFFDVLMQQNAMLQRYFEAERAANERHLARVRAWTQIDEAEAASLAASANVLHTPLRASPH